MKQLIASSFLVLFSNVVPIAAQMLPNSIPSDELGLMQLSFQIRLGFNNVLDAIDNFKTGDEQPSCMNPIYNCKTEIYFIS